MFSFALALAHLHIHLIVECIWVTGCFNVRKIGFIRKFHLNIPDDRIARGEQFEIVEFIIKHDSEVGCGSFGEFEGIASA